MAFERMNRRDFLRQSSAVVAASVALGAAESHAAEGLTGSTMRPLGATGLQASLLGMGTGVRAWGGNSELTRGGHDAFIALLTHAYERGVRYFDMADMYGAHPYVKEVMRGPVDRSKMTLLTKTVSRTGALVTADIERYRKELDTDYIDIVLLHCMTGPEWPDKLQEPMDALEDAKAKGLIRAHGVSCHHLGALTRAAETDWVDVILARINPFGVKMDGPPEEVVPVLQKAHDAGKGVLGMKIVGEGQCRDRIRESLEFVLNLGCVDAMPIGFLTADEVDSAFAHVEGIGAQV